MSGKSKHVPRYRVSRYRVSRFQIMPRLCFDIRSFKCPDIKCPGVNCQVQANQVFCCLDIIRTSGYRGTSVLSCHGGIINNDLGSSRPLLRASYEVILLHPTTGRPVIGVPLY